MRIFTFMRPLYIYFYPCNPWLSVSQISFFTIEPIPKIFKSTSSLENLKVLPQNPDIISDATSRYSSKYQRTK
ncbi:hypothetical protein D1AOALGA4SA_4294 [Olavius algarvensis Delta 1 endosymbiont]|nr:hypothetical protein D1AOALGA4SA_4294 [Olavius algarvensis Delta 1 endosymbiont]